MNILITGAGGLIGKALQQHLQAQGHTVHTMSRRDNSVAFYWEKTSEHDWEIRWDESIHIDAVVHLAGESIGNKRWTSAKKQLIYNSRVDTTRALAKKLGELANPPSVLISASAIGFYGDCGTREVDESAPAGNDFLAGLAVAWESAANAAAQHGIRVVNLRTGLVLSDKGGALTTMVTPFKMGVGGRLGSGRQWVSWISERDIARLITFLLEHPTAKGAINAASPNAVTNRDLTTALSRALCRPAVCHMPAFAVKALFGEMGELLLLGSIHVKPVKALALGFEFEQADLPAALAFALTDG